MICTSQYLPCYELGVVWYIPENSIHMSFRSPELTVKREDDKLDIFEQVFLQKAVQWRCFGTLRVSEI